MSDLASWSYTATATHWPKTGRGDWNGVTTYGAPVTFACAYQFGRVKAEDSSGHESLTKLKLWTEYAAVQAGDRVALGAFTDAEPPAASREVKSVTADQDVFGAKADDYTIEAI